MLQPLDPKEYLEWSRYERVYGLWKDGWVSDGQVRDALGVWVLELMAKQKLGHGGPPTVTVPQVDGTVVVPQGPLPDVMEVQHVGDTCIDGVGAEVEPDAGHDAEQPGLEEGLHFTEEGANE